MRTEPITLVAGVPKEVATINTKDDQGSLYVDRVADLDDQGEITAGEVLVCFDRNSEISADRYVLKLRKDDFYEIPEYVSGRLLMLSATDARVMVAMRREGAFNEGAL